MIDSPETIRQQMDETRSHLSEKLASLEHQVSKTVQSTGNAVNVTVESVRETVETVTEAVQGAVQSVSNAFDVRRQVEKHPWLILGGAVVVGYLAAELLTSPVKKPEPLAKTAPPPRPPMNDNTPAPADKPSQGQQLWHQLSSAAIGPLLGIVQDLASHAVPHVIDYLTGKRASDHNHQQSDPQNTAGSPGTNGRRKQLDPSDWA